MRPVCAGGRVQEAVRWGGDLRGGQKTLLAVVRSLPDGAGHVLLVGHNPGFEAWQER
ncbi:MAG: hypothetical protein R2844_07060 [Caldilineales bacterium]